MQTYLILLRGINVGGKNKVPMAQLRKSLEEAGFSRVSTYIASGNVILDSDKTKEQIKSHIEKLLPATFKLDSELVKVHVLTPAQLRAIIKNKPNGFGDSPETYHSDVAFLIDVSSKEALAAFSIREGVDTVWPGNGVIYIQRVSALRTKSKLSKVVASPLYASMTLRNWNTTTKLAQLLTERKKER